MKSNCSLSQPPVVFISLILTVVTLFGTGSSTVETIKASHTGSKTSQLNFTIYHAYGTKGYLATVANPVDHFHVFYSTQEATKGNVQECTGHTKTSIQALDHGCFYATNGGPFSFGEPSCIGYIVSNGTIVQIPGGEKDANFGLTRDGYFVLGELSVSQVKSMDFAELTSGFGWLLRSGIVLPGKGGEIAPRTAIGVDKLGRLLTFEADGVEAEDKGLTLYQLAQWLKTLGAFHAINLDGGGSSVTYYNGKVVSVPTCTDTLPPECERPVTTIMCVVN